MRGPKCARGRDGTWWEKARRTSDWQSPLSEVDKDSRTPCLPGIPRDGTPARQAPDVDQIISKNETVLAVMGLILCVVTGKWRQLWGWDRETSVYGGFR